MVSSGGVLIDLHLLFDAVAEFDAGDKFGLMIFSALFPISIHETDC
jgi:hypothetical protein